MIRRLAKRWADARLRADNEDLHDRWIRSQQRAKFLADERARLTEENDTQRRLLAIHRRVSGDRLAELDRLKEELKQLREDMP